MKGPREEAEEVEEEERGEERGPENKTLPRVKDEQASVTHITWTRINTSELAVRRG